MRSHPDEYGISRVDITEPSEPVSICATSPSLAKVYVADGASNTVLVTADSVPVPSPPEDEDETAAGLDVELAVGKVVELDEVPIMDAAEVCMHPFGEHTSFSPQHPPPVAAEH